MFLYYMIRDLCFLTFIHVRDDGSAEPKYVVYWHNFRTNGM
jgi:hypothetical protein